MGRDDRAPPDAGPRGEVDVGDVLDGVTEGVLAVDGSGTILFANRAAEERFGFEPGTLVGRVVDELLPERLREFHRAHRMGYVRHPTARAMGSRSELLARRADGSEFPVEVSLAPVRRGGDVLVVATIRDVTQIHRFTEGHRAIAEMVPDLAFVFRIHPDLTIEPEWATDSFERVTGYSAEAWVAAGGWAALVHPDDREAALGELGRILHGEAANINEVRILRPSGDIRWLHAWGRPLVDAAGQITSFVGAAQDITPQREAALALAESERRLKEAQRIAAVGSWRIDFATDTVESSEEQLRILGFGQDEPEPSMDDLLDCVHPEDRQLLQDRLVESIRTATPSEAEVRVIRRDGAVRWIQSRSFPVTDEHGAVVALQGTTQDLTERKEIEIALARHEADLEEAQAIAQVGIWVAEADGSGTWSKELYRIHGRDPSLPMPSLEEYAEWIDPADRADILAECRAAIEERRSYDVEYRIRRPDGQARWIHGRGGAVMDGDEIVAVRGTMQDITERKLVELELTRRETELEEAQTLARLGSWTFDVATQSARWSQEMYRIHGLPPDSPAPTLYEYLQLVHADDHDVTATEFLTAIQGKRPYTSEYRVILSDGSVRWLHATGTPVVERGEVVALRGTTQDITDRRREEERYRAISELISDAAYAFRVVDGVAYPEWITDSFVRLTGFHDEDPIALLNRWKDFVHPDDQAILVRSIKHALDGHQDLCEYRLATADGETRWIRAQARPVIENGTVVRIYGAAQDITDQRLAEEALRRAYERERDAAAQLRAADRLKDEFIATASHELRTPLTSIVGFASALARHGDKLDGDTRTELVEKLERNALELGGMVERLLDFSRLQSGTVDVEPRPIALRTVVDHCLESHVTATLARHRVEVSIPPRTMVLGDASALTHILSNLLTNAVKYSAEDSTIRIHAERRGEDEWVVSVADEGVGIAPDQQRRIFERFYRGADQPTGVRGSGIGLAIVRSYVELMGGRIWVESNPGAGARFAFTLPAASAARTRELRGTS